MGVQLAVNRWSNSLALKIHMCAQEGGQDDHCGNYNGVSADDQADFLLAQSKDENLFAKLEGKGISKVVAGKVSKKVKTLASLAAENKTTGETGNVDEKSSEVIKPAEDYGGTSVLGSKKKRFTTGLGFTSLHLDVPEHDRSMPREPVDAQR